MDTDVVLVTLHELIEVCEDESLRLRLCADHVECLELSWLLARQAVAFMQAAHDLQAHLEILCEAPAGVGGVTLHRGWVAMRGALSRYNLHAMLRQCERGEMVAVNRYRKAMQQPLPHALKLLIEQQAQNRERIYAEIAETFQAYLGSAIKTHNLTP